MGISASASSSSSSAAAEVESVPRKPARYATARRRTTSSSYDRPPLNPNAEKLEVDVESEDEDEDEAEAEAEEVEEAEAEDGEEETEGAEGAAPTSQRPRGKLVRSVGGSFAEEELDILENKIRLDNENNIRV